MFAYYAQNNSLLVFDCNLTRYLFSVTPSGDSLALRYQQQIPWKFDNGSIFINEYRTKFIVLPEQEGSLNSELVQWQTTNKAKVYLWMFKQLSLKPEFKDQFYHHDFYKACSLLR